MTFLPLTPSLSCHHHHTCIHTLSLLSSLDPLKNSTNVRSIARTWYGFSSEPLSESQDKLGSFLAKQPEEVNTFL